MSSKFKLFNFNKDGKGVSKRDVDGPPNLVTFFKKYKRKFSRLLSVNIFMVLGNFPVFFAGMALAGYGAEQSTIAASPLFPAVYTLSKFNYSPVSEALNSLFGLQAPLTAYTTISYILFGLSLLTLFTFGLTNIGTAYILRNLVKGDPVFMWSDFWYAIKRNWRQGLILGVIDLIAILLLSFNIPFYFTRLNGTFLNGILFYVSIAMALLYFAMRFYMYILLVTFDLSIFKILKNSLIFSILGFKRNFLATAGILLLLAINYVIFMYIPGLGIVLPLVLTISNCAFMTTYAAWFKIKEIMIDPYAQEPDEPLEAPLAKDDVE